MAFLASYINGTLASAKVDKIHKGFLNKGTVESTIRELQLNRKPVYSDVTKAMVIAELEDMGKTKFHAYLKRIAPIVAGVKQIQYLNIGQYLEAFVNGTLGAVKTEYLKKTFHHFYFQTSFNGEPRVWSSVTNDEIIGKFEQWIENQVKVIDETEDKVLIGDTETITYTDLHS